MRCRVEEVRQTPSTFLTETPGLCLRGTAPEVAGARGQGAGAVEGPALPAAAVGEGGPVGPVFWPSWESLRDCCGLFFRVATTDRKYESIVDSDDPVGGAEVWTAGGWVVWMRRR